MTVSRGIWHGEAWDRDPVERYNARSVDVLRHDRDHWQQLAWRQRDEIERLTRDVARMKHVMDQRAEIIRDMRAQAKPLPTVLPWEYGRLY